jgi:crossover junction endodeoxyribonuclease RusA
MIGFSVYGIPKAQGSVRAFKNIIVQGGSKEGRIAQASWRTLIVDAARRACFSPLEGPVYVSMTFYLPKPKSTPKSVLWPGKKPDLDKLVRAAADAMSTIVYHDDSQIVHMMASKRYAFEKRTPGLDVVVMSCATTNPNEMPT